MLHVIAKMGLAYFCRIGVHHFCLCTHSGMEEIHLIDYVLLSSHVAGCSDGMGSVFLSRKFSFFSYRRSGISNMAIVEVKTPTGWVPVKESLQGVRRVFLVVSN